MSEYLTPGVFIKDNPNPPVLEATSASTGGFIGVAQRGEVGKPIFINSWNAYITNFANGMDSPFIADSDLAYAVYGFFQNGGKKCYVMRVASSTAKASTMTRTVDTNTLVINARDEGVWGNNLKVLIKANADTPENFDIEVTLGDSVVEVLRNLSNDSTSATYWVDVLDSQSKYIKAGTTTTGSGTTAVTSYGNLVASATKTETVNGEQVTTYTLDAFLEGADGVTDIKDTDFTGKLSEFDVISDINLLCIPGQTSATVTKALMDYCENRKDIFAILDAPEASTVDSVLTLRKTMNCKNAALYFPWIRVTDPLSKNGKLRSCPTCGHVMGVYARTIAEKGVWRVPAGTDAVVRGAIEVTTTFTSADTDKLNPVGIVPIVSKPNYGIVLWGARNLHPDTSMKYISDVLLDIYIKKSVYESTQPFVFEPNDPNTWTRISTLVQSFLDNLWMNGALQGSSAKEAYYVKCDEDLNTAEMREAGQILCEVGYANKKPSEFIIFRFSHQVASN